MITAIALDDEPLSIQAIKEYCSKIDYIDLKRTFTRAEQAFEFISTNKIDLLFLDIEMPLISGIDFYKKVPKGTAVIFITAYYQYAVEGFNLNAIDYLLKPFNFARFSTATEKAKEHFRFQNLRQTTDEEYLFLKIDYSIKKIPFDDIIYIEGKDNYAKIYLEDGKYILARLVLKSLQQLLPVSQFARIHKSYIVSKKKVSAYRNRIVYIGDMGLPTSALYQSNVNDMFKAD